MEQPSEQAAVLMCGVGSRPGTLLSALFCTSLIHVPWVGWGQKSTLQTGKLRPSAGRRLAQARWGGGVGWRAAGQGEVPRTAVLSLQLGDRLPPGRAGVPRARAGPGGASAAPVPAAAAARRVSGTAGGRGRASLAPAF